MGHDDDPGLPIELGPISNGEYLPLPSSAVAREAQRRAFDLADELARVRGIDRRRFLQSVCGAATLLFVLDACSREEQQSKGTEPGGTFTVPEPATTEPEVAREVVGGDEFVFDVQTHLLDPAAQRAAGVGFGQSFPQSACGEADWRACYSVEHWLQELFARSDTAMAVISAVPILSDPNPLSIAIMEDAKRAAQQLCGDGRIFLHGQTNPNVGDLDAQLEAMRALRAEHPIAAWKVYTHVPRDRGWYFDDHDPDAVQCGARFLEAVREAGPPIVCVHKGFGSGSAYSAPVDIGPAARDNPDISFVVYHSGFEPAGSAEGPYTPETADRGVNRLLASLESAGVGPGANVYAELGSTWFYALRDPTAAAHILGKLMKHLGEDRVVWGTDSIWYGSPQGQIEAFRAFEISEELQEQYGYPALTDTVKRKVLGGNSAALYGVEPVVTPCGATDADVEELRMSLPPPRAAGPRTAAGARALQAADGGLA